MASFHIICLFQKYNQDVTFSFQIQWNYYFKYLRRLQF